MFFIFFFLCYREFIEYHFAKSTRRFAHSKISYLPSLFYDFGILFPQPFPHANRINLAKKEENVSGGLKGGDTSPGLPVVQSTGGLSSISGAAFDRARVLGRISPQKTVNSVRRLESRLEYRGRSYHTCGDRDRSRG